MNKVLVYVDAENVKYEDVEECVKGIRSSLGKNEVMLGKFFGNSSVIGTKIIPYVSLGLEFVETSFLCRGCKNVSDMKLVVDCMSEVAGGLNDSISKVIIMSCDYDFGPLVLKIKGLGIECETPFMNLSENNVSIRDLNEELSRLDWHALEQPDYRCFDNQFTALRDLLDERFSDELILQYLSIKQRKFLRSMIGYLSDDDLACLNAMSSLEFSFRSVMSCESFDFRKLKFAIKCYTLKFFGRSFSDKDLENVINDFSLVTMEGL